MTVHVTVTNKGVTMHPTRAPRGQTAIFLVSNYATSSRVFSLGNQTTRKRGAGFVVKLAPNAQKRVLRYLDIRGRLPSTISYAGKTKVVGVFVVT